jgi:hypothetical protein
MFRLFINDMVGKPMETKSGNKTEGAPAAHPPPEGVKKIHFL